jgi:hypothetical protein
MAGHPLFLRNFRVRPPNVAFAAPAALAGRLAAVAALCGALVSLSCFDALTPRAGRRARIAVQPQFSPRDAAIYSRLAAIGLPVTTVHVVLVRPPSDTVADTSVTVTPGVDSIPLTIDVRLAQDQEQFDATIELLAGNVLLFVGTGPVVGYVLPLPGQEPSVIVPVWVGPGSQSTSIVISPGDTAIAINTSVALSATAYDAGNTAVTDDAFTSRYEWHVVDTTLGTIPLHGGSFTAKGVTGTTAVWVETANLLRDTVFITVTPPTPVPTSISVPDHFEMVQKGTTYAISATVLDQFGNTMSGVARNFVSRNTVIASVGSGGVVTAKAMGQTIIVANVTGTGLKDSLLVAVPKLGGPALFSSINQFTYATNTSITVSIFVDMRNSGKLLGSTTVDVTWDPAQLTYMSNANGNSGVVPTVNSSNTGSGTLTLAMADVNGFAGNVELLKVTFNTASTAQSGQLQLSARELHATDYTDLLPVTLQVTHPLAIQ